MDEDNINWNVLDRDIPLGHTAGLLVGKVFGGLVNTVRHPILAVSQGAGTCEGFFQGVKHGLEITNANFELARMRGSVKKMTGEQQKNAANVIKGMEKISTTDTALAQLLERIRELPAKLKQQIFTEEQLTPVPSA